MINTILLIHNSIGYKPRDFYSNYYVLKDLSDTEVVFINTHYKNLISTIMCETNILDILCNLSNQAYLQDELLIDQDDIINFEDYIYNALYQKVNISLILELMDICKNKLRYTDVNSLNNDIFKNCQSIISSTSYQC